MTQARFKVKRGDFVRVMAGRDKGKTGVVKKVLLNEARVVVEGVHHVVRCSRPNAMNPEGRTEKDLPIHVSNVMVVDPTNEAPTRLGYRFNAEGKKERFFKKSGNTVEEHRA